MIEAWDLSFNVLEIFFLVLVLVFVVYNRQKERHFPKADPYDDVRENIINYDDEGGGEDDMTAFDITPLQIPVGPAIGNGGPLLGKMPCEYRVLSQHDGEGEKE